VSCGTDTKLYKPDVCPQVMEFYHSHAFGNKWLEVSDRKNVSNPTGAKGGGKGVFAKKEIPPNTLLCPYVGRVFICACHGDEPCLYDLKVHDSYYICAREEKVDTVYFNITDVETYNGYKGNHTDSPSEPNYGRYFNTVKEGQGGAFNCSFEPDVDGYEVIFIWTGDRVVNAGEELLVDYGKSFVV
jgi:hypothetical protein